MYDEQVAMTRTGDDGAAGAIDAQTLQSFVTDIQEINSETGSRIRLRQREADDTRFCRWPGQSPDGRRWSDTLKKAGLKGSQAEAFPFEGAPDSRIRLADFVTNFRAGVRFLSVLRASGIPQVFGTEGQDMKVAAKVKLMLRYIVRNLWGPEFLRQVMLSAQYVENHNPGACIVLSIWRREYGLEMEKVSLDTVAQKLLEAARREEMHRHNMSVMGDEQPNPGMIDPATLENIDAVIQLLTTPGRESEAAAFLVSMFPEVKPARARKMVRDLQEKQETVFPKKVLAVNQPEVRTLKLYEDVFVRSNAVNLEDTPVHIPELLTPVQLRERVVSQRYDAKTVDELLGEGAFKDRGNHIGKTKLFAEEQQAFINRYGDTADPYRGYVEVISTIYRASNEDGMPVWCIVRWTPHLDGKGQGAESIGCRALTKRETLYSHGKFPGVFISRETISKYLLDARSSAELAQSDQSLLKMFTDLSGAAGQLKSLPPIEESLSRPASYETGIKPLGRIKRKKAGDIGVLRMGDYSRENVDAQEQIVRRACEYFGIPHPEVSAVVTDVEQQVITLFFCAAWAQVQTLTVKLCQENWTETELARITGPDGAPVAQSIEEIRGGWNVQLSYAPADLDPETVGKTIEQIQKALGSDTLVTANRALLTEFMFYLINPVMAERVIQPEEMASAKEIEDEQRIFTMIVAAGVEPERVTEGKNFALRLQWLDQQMQQNPEPVMRAPETNRLILEAHRAHYEQMVTQQQNVQVGREGSARILS